MPADRASGLRVAFYGAMSLLAREVRLQLDEKALPVRTLKLYDTGEHEGSVTDWRGEAMVVVRPDEDLVEDTDLAFVCAEDDPRSADYVTWAGRGGGIVVDLAGASRADRGVPVVNCDVNPEAIRPDRRLLSAPHPLAHPLSTILHRLRGPFRIREAVATVFRPVSDHGEAGIEELHRQTVGLLSFSAVPKEVFGRQMAFNLVPLSVQGGTASRLEERVRDDVRRVLSDPDLPLGLRIIQAPVFHGHGYSIRIDIDGSPVRDDVAGALALEGAVSISGEDDGRTPAELATESGIWIGDITAEPRRPGAFWIWAVADAVRSGAALNAARMAERLAEIRV